MYYEKIIQHIKHVKTDHVDNEILFKTQNWVIWETLQQLVYLLSQKPV